MNSIWPRHPLIYEINTWVWLSGLSAKIGCAIDLSFVPAVEWDAIAKFGFEAVWLMGVWERSPASSAISNRDQALLDDLRRALPDFRAEDNVGSAYSVRRYTVDPHLGGAEGLATARRELARRGMRLILDFVPNHVAMDHPWAIEHQEYFIRGRTEDARDDRAFFIPIEGRVYARGREPYFPAWPDVLHLNAFTLIPEVPFHLEGEGGFLAALERRVVSRGHAVIAVAEGAGQELLGNTGIERDASGNVMLSDIGLFLREKIEEWFKARNIPFVMRYFDPSYLVRSSPANAADSVLCDVFARHAAHAAMAGKTGLVIGFLHDRFIHVPIELLANHQKRVDPNGPARSAVLATTGQPHRFE